MPCEAGQCDEAGRKVEAIEPAGFMMLSLNASDRIRLIDAPDDVIAIVGDCIQSYWAQGLQVPPQGLNFSRFEHEIFVPGVQRLPSTVWLLRVQTERLPVELPGVSFHLKSLEIVRVVRGVVAGTTRSPLAC